MPATLHYEHDIHVVDAEYVRPGLAAVHLVIEGDRAALIDTGTGPGVPNVLAALAELGVAPSGVDYVIVTHVHLDHAGAAGALLAACPNARLVVHPKGARHLIDPSKLVQSALAVYGEVAFRAHHGDIVPAPAERVIEAGDGFVLDFGRRRFSFIDTPGHARHHYCIHDSLGNGIFTGDTFGISYREFDVAGRPFIFPTTTPVQFEPAPLHASFDRIVASGATAAYLTHYGRVTGLPRLVTDLHELLDRYVELALAAPGAGAARHAWLAGEMETLLLKRARAHGCSLEDATIKALLANDVDLNTQGLLVWRDRLPEPASAPA
jgi:glyoxylase-like metal-dependent hydrolase (beta-lactamase superfamily II)